jgi:hypothetical protein
MTEIDVADLDCIYLSYDEPQKEEFWVQIKNMVPWAKRVDGVKGSDAAHKAAADASDTDRFILIDGDNMPSPDFFDLTLELEDEEYERATFRWRARNHINGLMYGNGGLSSWTKDFVYNMRTHENSDGSDDTNVEFCFDPLYWAMHDCYSTTYPNATPFQAWRAGFREGVKMCLDRGHKPTMNEFKQRANGRNLDNLNIWHTVGRDVENGIWAIAGARQGTLMTMLSDWDHTEVQWFDNLERLWSEMESQDPDQIARENGKELARLDLDVVELDQEQSKFFKRHYRSNWRNQGPMVREIDV